MSSPTTPGGTPGDTIRTPSQSELDEFRVRLQDIVDALPKTKADEIIENPDGFTADEVRGELEIVKTKFERERPRQNTINGVHDDYVNSLKEKCEELERILAEKEAESKK